MAIGRSRAVGPVFSQPPARYDPGDQAAFRREVERFMEATAEAVVPRTSEVFAYFGSATEATADGVSEKIKYDTEVYDADGAFDTTNNKFVVPETGIYIVSAQLRWDANTTGVRTLSIKVGGVLQAVNSIAGASSFVDQQCVYVGRLAADDEVTVDCFQNSTGGLNYRGGSKEETNIQIVRIA